MRHSEASNLKKFVQYDAQMTCCLQKRHGSRTHQRDRVPQVQSIRSECPYTRRSEWTEDFYSDSRTLVLYETSYFCILYSAYSHADRTQAYGFLLYCFMQLCYIEIHVQGIALAYTLFHFCTASSEPQICIGQKSGIT